MFDGFLATRALSPDLTQFIATTDAGVSVLIDVATGTTVAEFGAGNFFYALA